jgi:hypothetical protein
LKLSRRKARELGKRLGKVVSRPIVAKCGERSSSSAPRRWALPASGKGGLRPGIDLDDSSALADVMDDRD